MRSFPDMKMVKLILGRVAPSEVDIDEVRSALMENTSPDDIKIVISAY